TKHGDAGRKWRSVFAPVACILLITVVWIAYYNWRVTGNPLEVPYTEAIKTYDRSALFLWQKAKPPQHYDSKELEVFYNQFKRENYDRTWADVKEITSQKLTRCGVILAWPALLLVVPGLIFAYRDRRAHLIIATFIAVAIAFSLSAWPNPHYLAP